MAETNCRCPFYRGVHPIEVSVQSDSNVFETVLTQCMLVGAIVTCYSMEEMPLKINSEVFHNTTGF